MSLGAAAMSMAGSNPEAEALSEAAKQAFEAKDYAQAVECYRAASQIAPTCATRSPCVCVVVRVLFAILHRNRSGPTLA